VLSGRLGALGIWVDGAVVGIKGQLDEWELAVTLDHLVATDGRVALVNLGGLAPRAGKGPRAIPVGPVVQERTDA